MDEVLIQALVYQIVALKVTDEVLIQALVDEVLNVHRFFKWLRHAFFTRTGQLL